jgi:hypothetical protein
MTTDEEAETFLGSDLSDIDFAQFKTVRFEFSDQREHPKKRGSPAVARPSDSQPVHLSPGTPAPKSGVYQQTGPRGGRPGEIVTSVRGSPLPAAPKGRAWTLVQRRRQKTS